MLLLFGGKAGAQDFPAFHVPNAQGVEIYYKGIHKLDLNGNIIDEEDVKYVKVVSPINNPDFPENTGETAYNYNYAGLDGNGNITTPLTIPEQVYDNITQQRYTVIEIGDGAFNGCSGIKGGLSLPPTIMRIDDNAFSGCTNIVGTLTFPRDLISIGEAAFERCAFTGTLTIPTTVGDRIGDYAFAMCKGFTGNLNIPSSMTKIGNHVFDGCSGFNGTLSIDDNIKSIGNYAFNECSGFIGSLKFSKNVNEIGRYAFCKCFGFSDLDLPHFTGDGTINNPPPVSSTITKISSHAFAFCTGLTGVLKIYSGVTSIDSSAFHDCYSLEGVILSQGLTLIDDNAFSYCPQLHWVTIPSSVQTISSSAFAKSSRCVVVIPDECTTTTIGKDAFDLIKGVWFTNTKPSNFSFSGELGQTTYYLPEDDTSDKAQEAGSIKAGYQTLITDPDAIFRYYHLGLTTVERLLAPVTQAKYGHQMARVSTLYVNFPALVPSYLVAYKGISVPNSSTVLIESLDYSCNKIDDKGNHYTEKPSISNNVTDYIIPTKCGVVLLGDESDDLTSKTDTVFEAVCTSAAYEKGSYYRKSIEPTESNGDPADKGILSGSLVDRVKLEVEDAGNGKVYTLGALPDDDNNPTGPVGFRPFQGATLSAHKAYLLKTDAMLSKGDRFIIDIANGSDTPTGISGIKNAEEATDSAPYYNLEGMKVNKPAKGGIYIHNGKKIVIY
jgi:hypothetical protein